MKKQAPTIYGFIICLAIAGALVYTQDPALCAIAIILIVAAIILGLDIAIAYSKSNPIDHG